jgi:hypothetical protein
MSDVDLLRVQRVGLQIAGDPVVEAHAERDEQVGLLNRGIDPGFAVHPHHAEVQGMRRRTPADAEQRHRNGNVRLLGECQKRCLRAAENDAVAGENQRTLGRVDQRDRIDAHRVPGPGQRRQIRGGGVPVELGVAELRVLRDVDQHRARDGRWPPPQMPRESQAPRRSRASRGSCAS